MPAVVKKSPSEKIQDDALEAVDVTDALAGVDLSNAPKLKPYRVLRVRERAVIMGVVEKLETDTSDLIGQYLQLAEMDEALEKVALDPDTYAEWAVGDEPEIRITALFMRYAEQVGESMRSAS